MFYRLASYMDIWYFNYIRYIFHDALKQIKHNLARHTLILNMPELGVEEKGYPKMAVVSRAINSQLGSKNILGYKVATWML